VLLDLHTGDSSRTGLTSGNNYNDLSQCQLDNRSQHINAVPVTEVREKHSLHRRGPRFLRALASQHKDTETHPGKKHTHSDLEEKVYVLPSSFSQTLCSLSLQFKYQNIHHVIQSVIQEEVVDRHRIHTCIPVHHSTHEVPSIHKSSTLAMQDFLQGDGSSVRASPSMFPP